MRNLFLRLEEFGNICGTNFCDLGPKSQKFVPQKLMPQHFMPAKINALKVDYHIMTKKCKPCQVWDKKKGTPEYDKWKTEHKCTINNKGSAGSMESAGAVAIFKRSVRKHKLRYKYYIGDGDSRSFSKVVQSKPYGDDSQ